MKRLLSSDKNIYIISMRTLVNKLKRNTTLRLFRNFFEIIFNLYLKSLLTENKKNNSINFIVEKANWAIRWDGIYITKSINRNFQNDISIISSIPKINSNKKVIHFASQYMWLDWEKLLPKRHKYIVSFFHGKPDDSQEVKESIEKFLNTQDKIYKVITAANLIQNRLISWGIPKEKIVLIHTGVDTKLFNIPTVDKRNKIREKLGLEVNDLVIGSFQKDGIGWSKGEYPKLIKGPDIFVKTVELISKHFSVTVILTGPARGYIKKELYKRNIKFKHIFLDHYEDIVSYYHALDLYIVSSREEGGPKPMIESMACGVPLVTTNVGMADDFIRDKINGGIIDSFDPYDLANKSMEILNLQKETLIQQARKDVLKADWDVVAKLHWENVYKPALVSLNRYKNKL